MTPLKWFAGGSERRCEAMTIIDHLLEDIKDTPQLTPLKNLLVSYKRRLEDDGTSNRLLFYVTISPSRSVRCETKKPPAMRVRVEGYTKKTPNAIQ
jgi:hypothetical protein